MRPSIGVVMVKQTHQIQPYRITSIKKRSRGDVDSVYTVHFILEGKHIPVCEEIRSADGLIFGFVDGFVVDDMSGRLLHFSYDPVNFDAEFVLELPLGVAPKAAANRLKRSVGNFIRSELLEKPYPVLWAHDAVFVW